MKRYAVLAANAIWVSLLLVAAQLVQAEPAGTMSYMSLDVLLVFYPTTAYGALSDADMQGVQEHMDEVRMFYWRNSRCALNLAWDPTRVITIARSLHEEDFREMPGDRGIQTKLVKPELIGEDLLAMGVRPNQYAIVVVIAPGNGWLGGGQIPRLGSTKGVAMGPVQGYGVTVTGLIHEIHHAIESIANDSLIDGHEHMYPNVHPDFSGIYGPDRDASAYILRTWPRRYWFQLKPVWATRVDTADVDQDGLPDDDPRVPMDEARFGSDPTRKDTDGDGLDDLSEFAAGQDRSTNPRARDTDSDGIEDGQDAEPLYAVNTVIAKQTPIVDGTIESGPWTPFMYDADRSGIATSLAWDQSALYVGLWLTKGLTPVTVWIDAHHDGFLHSPQPDAPDNYELVIDPVGRTVRVAHLRYAETTIQAGGPVWNESMIRPDEIRYAFNSTGTQVELAIPANARTSLQPAHGYQFGMTVFLGEPEQGLFGPDHLVTVTLRDASRHVAPAVPSQTGYVPDPVPLPTIPLH